MTPAGFEPATPVSERLQPHASDRAATTNANIIFNNTTAITTNTNTNITVFNTNKP